MNAMAYHPSEGILDYFGGREDLKRGIIRCVGNPEERFNEDALRMLRALRFASRFGFSLSEETALAMKRCRNLLTQVSNERIWSELNGFLLGAHTAELLLAFRAVFAVVLPEIEVTFDFDQKNPHHCYSVWEHIARSVEAAPADPIVKWTMLFHDVGKPHCFSEDEFGIGHFYGHAKESALLAEQALRRLKSDRATMEAVIELVTIHDRYRAFTDVSVRRIASRYGIEQTERLFAVMEADCRAQSEHEQEQKLGNLQSGRQLFASLLEHGACLKISDLAIGGRELIALGIPRGPIMGQLLNRLLDEVLENRLQNEQSVLLHQVQKWVNVENASEGD